MHQMVRYYALLSLICLSSILILPKYNSQIYAQESNDSIRIHSVFVNRGLNNVTMSWKTDPTTLSKVEYADESGVWEETLWSDSPTSDHSFTLLNLKEDSTYLYRISAEDTSGSIKTKTGNFTTLRGDVLGETQITPSTALDEGGFKTLLTPYATIPSTPTPISNPWDPYTSQGYQFMPFYPIPIPIAYQPVLGTQTQQEKQTEPTATPLPPTPTPLPVTGSVDSGSVTLIVGLFAGILISFLLHQLSQPGKNIFRQDITSKLQKPKETEIAPEHQTYKFSINND